MAYPLSIRTRSPEIARFVRFALVGAASTLVDFGLLMALTMLAGLPVLAANLISYPAGILTSFSLNRRWTFSETRDGSPWPQLARFVAVSLAGLAMNSAIVALLAGAFGTIGAKLIATAMVLGWNFFANRRWTFTEKGED